MEAVLCIPDLKNPRMGHLDPCSYSVNISQSSFITKLKHQITNRNAVRLIPRSRNSKDSQKFTRSSLLGNLRHPPSSHSLCRADAARSREKIGAASATRRPPLHTPQTEIGRRRVVAATSTDVVFAVPYLRQRVAAIQPTNSIRFGADDARKPERVISVRHHPLRQVLPPKLARRASHLTRAFVASCIHIILSLSPISICLSSTRGGDHRVLSFAQYRFAVRRRLVYDRHAARAASRVHADSQPPNESGDACLRAAQCPSSVSQSHAHGGRTLFKRLDALKKMLTPRRSGPISPEEISNRPGKKSPQSPEKGSVSPGSFSNGEGGTKEFLSTGRTGRRNAMPDIRDRHAETGLLDLPDRFGELSTTTDPSTSGHDPKAPSTSKKQG